ncbi:alpha/beta hydrolase [Novipirellula artificiosorum]|nr:alpha/beta hydrolase [Novipirellula artificiosorum]
MIQKIRLTTIFVFCGFLPLAVVAAAEPDEVPAGEVHVYKTSGGKPQQMEVYVPPEHDPETEKVPGLILFHGGGWGGGDLTQFRRACQYFASRGLVCATSNYRMLTKDEAAALPERDMRKAVCVTDAKSAIRWFKAQAGEFGIDPKRIVTGGGSAGGHVATLATLNPDLNDPGDPKHTDVSVVAYLLFNPAFSKNTTDSAIDPLPHLKQDMAPAIVFFGTKDHKWLEGWNAVFTKLVKLGNTTTEVQMAEGEAHAFFNKPPWQDVTLRAADEFLIRQGILGGSPTIQPPTTGEALVPAADVE